MMYQSELRDICLEIFKGTPLNYFSYSTTNVQKGVFKYITTHPQMSMERFDRDFPLLSLFLDPGYYWAKAFMPPEALKMYKSMDIDNVFYIIEEREDFIDVYTFGTSCAHPDMVNFYFNNIPMLQKLILRFKEMTRGMMMDTSKNMRTIDEKLQTKYYEHFLKEGVDEHPFMVEKFYNPISKEWISLSERERDILMKSALEGFTAAQIGDAINLSPKTIESHLDNLRAKLSAKSTKELLKRAVQMGLIKIHTYF